MRNSSTMVGQIDAIEAPSYELPPLPYERYALEPYLSEWTLDVHYDRHHRGYLRKLEHMLGAERVAETGIEGLLHTTDGEVFNCAAQVWNHTFYWSSMTPGGGGNLPRDLEAAIRRDFGSVDDVKRRLADTANSQFGSGWGWLVADQRKRLHVVATHDADNPLFAGLTPLLTIDVWEHAYYLDYRDERARYVTAYLDHLINWDFAAARLAEVGLQTGGGSIGSRAVR